MSQPITFSSFQELVNQFRANGLGVCAQRVERKKNKDKKNNQTNDEIVVIPTGSKPKNKSNNKSGVTPYSPRLDSELAHYMEEYNQKFGLVH